MVSISSFKLSDLTIGQSDEIKIDVSIDDIDKFAKISGDYSPIHIDDEFAKLQGLNGRIAHGMLIGSFISRFIGNRLPGRYGILQSIDLEFRKPLIPPDRIQIKGEIINITKSVGQIVIKIIVTNNEGLNLAIAKVKSIIKDDKI